MVTVCDVVAGSATTCASPEPELPLVFFRNALVHETTGRTESGAPPGRSERYHPWLTARGEGADLERRPVARRCVDEMTEDLEGLGATSRPLGATVHRPLTPHPDTTEGTTPAWPASDVPSLNRPRRAVGRPGHRLPVNEACPESLRALEEVELTVVPIRHRWLSGGAFHRFTLDTVRDGGPRGHLV
ncbi:hypothetical protein SANTM175S_09448 [Streptomyces antimycoticus]